MKADCSKDNLEKIVRDSLSLTEILRKLGLSIAGKWNRDTIKKYIIEYDINTSHFISGGKHVNNNKQDLKNILINGSTLSSNHLKGRLYDEGLKERKCELCGQDEEWNGKHMSLILDHINGINNDNRPENLRIVCPNCNATLDTHCRGFSKLNNMKLKNDKKSEQFEKNKILNKNRYMSSRIVKRPTYDVLQKEISEMGREAIGRKYGVTGNAIKKWVNTYEKHGY